MSKIVATLKHPTKGELPIYYKGNKQFLIPPSRTVSLEEILALDRKNILNWSSREYREKIYQAAGVPTPTDNNAEPLSLDGILEASNNEFVSPASVSKKPHLLRNDGGNSQISGSTIHLDTLSANKELTPPDGINLDDASTAEFGFRPENIEHLNKNTGFKKITFIAAMTVGVILLLGIAIAIFIFLF